LRNPPTLIYVAGKLVSELEGLGSQPIRTLISFLNLTDSQTWFQSLYIVTENVKAELTAGTDEGNFRFRELP